MSHPGQDAVIRLVQLLKTMNMYPSDHPRVEDRMAGTLDCFDDLFSRDDQLLVGIDGGQLLVQNTTADESEVLVREFKYRLKERKIANLIFERGFPKTSSGRS